jgi:hypothetical protein
MARSRSLRRGLTRLDEVAAVKKDYRRKFHNLALGDQELDSACYIGYPRFACNTIYVLEEGKAEGSAGAQSRKLSRCSLSVSFLLVTPIPLVSHVLGPILISVICLVLPLLLSSPIPTSAPRLCHSSCRSRKRYSKYTSRQSEASRLHSSVQQAHPRRRKMSKMEIR